MKYLRFIPAIIIILIIWYWSDIPGLKSEYTPIIDFFLRKGAHILEYALLYLALFWAFLPQSIFTLSLNQFDLVHIQSFIIGFMATLLDEWHQTWVPGREGKPLDIGFDILGFLFAYILIWSIWTLYSKSKTTSIKK